MISILCLALRPSYAQDMTKQMLEEADSARLAYDFPKAEEICQRVIAALDSSSRTEATEHLILAQNGLSMMNFCSTPKVVAKQVFSLKDFFLFYPLQDHSWRKVPNQLDSIPTKDCDIHTRWGADSAIFVNRRGWDTEYLYNEFQGHRMVCASSYQ